MTSLFTSLLLHHSTGLYYEELLQILRAPWHEDYEDMRTWAGEDFDPDVFNPAHVRFDDPRKRWDIAFVDA